jgi:broad specificity phosphatase PhoE
MKIVVARHGRPDLELPRVIWSDDLRAVVERYDRSGINPVLAPPAALVRLAAEAGCVVCSPLQRARDSVQLVAPDQQPIVLDALREAALPCPARRTLPLPLAAWVAIARIAWLLGWSPGAESRALAVSRASRAARDLIRLAEGHGTVMVFGHDMFNRLLSGALRRQGWVGRRPWINRYWGFQIYRPGGERLDNSLNPRPGVSP